jgi:hypothetical protein
MSDFLTVDNFDTADDCTIKLCEGRKMSMKILKIQVQQLHLGTKINNPEVEFRDNGKATRY